MPPKKRLIKDAKQACMSKFLKTSKDPISVDNDDVNMESASETESATDPQKDTHRPEPGQHDVDNDSASDEVDSAHGEVTMSKSNGKYQHSWDLKHTWLEYDGVKMYCKLCRKCSKC